jgi:hypothetical protein
MSLQLVATAATSNKVVIEPGMITLIILCVLVTKLISVASMMCIQKTKEIIITQRMLAALSGQLLMFVLMKQEYVVFAALQAFIIVYSMGDLIYLYVQNNEKNKE